MATPNELIATIEGLPSINDVQFGIHDLSEIKEDSLSLPILEYPLGALRRTQGGSDGETLISISFKVDPTRTGHRSLELLAHIVTDASRSKSAIQLRAAARPVAAMAQIQTDTLTFFIDWWATSETDLGQDAQTLIDLIEFSFESIMSISPDHFKE